MVVHKCKRAPSALVAKRRAAQKNALHAAKGEQASIEAQHRKSGGYGKSVVSIYDEPKGGIKKSPAYLKVLARCGGSKMPPAKERAGAPVKGGFPLAKYPVNVIVDGQRVSWLPDDWAQVIKNTGPGGVYIGWMSPDGKFCYHRNGYDSGTVELLAGKPLTALDGINGILRSVAAAGVSVKNDKAFLQKCLTPSERKNLLPANKFHFGVVSARRANSDRGIHDLMIVDAHFRVAGVRPTWYVDADSLQDYKRLGLDAVVGGKLTPARNMILNDAAKKGKVAVEVSDDIGKWLYYDVEKQDLRGQTDFKKANQALAGTKAHVITPLAAAQFMLAKMRSSPAKPKLAGVFPTGNATMTMGFAEYGTEHFILGDFFVADLSPCRFDESMSLKEDYDFTCSHIAKHGSVLRCNRMLLQVRHYANQGGAVDVRNVKKERENIAILQRKWPGVFKMNVKRPSEVLMRWNGYGKADDDRKAKSSSAKVKKIAMKAKAPLQALLPKSFSLTTKLKYEAKPDETEYIAKRCKKSSGKTVGQCLGMLYLDANGNERKYGLMDLKYDISTKRLTRARA